MELGSLLSLLPCSPQCAVCECPCVKRFFFSPALPPADPRPPHPPTPLWLRRRSGATQRRASDAKPRSNPSVYLGLEARPQPLPLLSPKDLRQTFIYWPPASVPQPRPLSSGRPLPAPLSQCERICMEQQSVLPGQWPVGDGTGPLTAAVCSGTHGFRRMWPSVGVGGERGQHLRGGGKASDRHHHHHPHHVAPPRTADVPQSGALSLSPSTQMSKRGDQKMHN